MKVILSVLLLLFSISASAQNRVFIDVPAGDVIKLEKAIVEAGERGAAVETWILTHGTFLFKESGLPNISGNIIIQGHHYPVIFEGEGEGPGELLVVDSGAKLRLINVELANFSLDRSGAALIQNQGELSLTKVQVRNVFGSQFCLSKMGCTEVMPAIRNFENASLLMNQVSIIESGIYGNPNVTNGEIISNQGEARLENTQIFATSRLYMFYNSGTMVWDFVTLYTDSPYSPPLMRTAADGYGLTQVSNSIVSGFNADWCAGNLSLGYNLVDNFQCDFTAEGDRIGIPIGLHWRPVEVSWSSNTPAEILTHALVPISASPAVDSVPITRCGHYNLLGDFRYQDGNADGINGCDIGAVEVVPVTLDQGGINGVYFNPDSDGHYISIIDNPYNTLVMWNSFDKKGNQYFVHGTGELVAGRSLIADAYISMSGSTSPDSELVPAQEVYWGTLEVEMTNCNEGTLAFQSDFPEFGSGQISLERLVFVKQLGCVD